MKKLLLLCVFSLSWVFGQSQDVLTNEIIIRMFQSGVPSATIIRTISSADRVDFDFLGPALQRLIDVKLPEEVIKAMAAKDKGRPIPGQPAPAPNPSQSGVAPQKSQSSGNVQNAQGGEIYQGKGMWNVTFAGSAVIPHSSPSDTVGLIQAQGGYFVTRGLMIGAGVTGLFQRDVQTAVLTAGGRYFFGSEHARILPYVGAGVGGAFAQAFGYGDGKFAADASAGLRVFLVRHVAMDVGYELVYVKISGLGFQDSSVSTINVGLSYVFGHR